MLTEELMREVRRLQIRARRRVDDLFAGEYHSAFRGQGLEFAEVREYEAGDDVRTIDWNVTARTGRPFIKRYVEERQLTVVLAVDVSASGAFGTVGRTKGRLAVEAAAVLGLAATRSNDRVGLLLFSDGVELYVQPRKGQTHLLRIMRDLLGAEPRGRGTSLVEPLRFLSRVLPRHAVVFIASDFTPTNPDEDWQTPLRLLSRRHEVVALTVSDPREARLPALGLVEFEDPETGRLAAIDAGSRRVRRALEAAAEAQGRRVAAALAGAKVDRVEISTDRPFVHDLVRYFRLRERRRER